MNREQSASGDDCKVGAFSILIDTATISQLLALSHHYQILTEPTQKCFHREWPSIAGEYDWHSLPSPC